MAQNRDTSAQQKSSLLIMALRRKKLDNHLLVR